MSTSTPVDAFYTVVIQHAMKETASAQDALRGYWEESATTSHACVAAWLSAQRASLLATFQVQSAVIQSSQSMFDAGLQSNPVLVDRPVRSGRAGLAKTVRLTTVAPPHTDAPFRGTIRILRDQMRANDWATSAMNFIPPIGILASGYADFLDGKPDSLDGKP